MSPEDLKIDAEPVIDLTDISEEVKADYDFINNTFITEDVIDNPKDLVNVEIGDSKQTDFHPQAKITRWGNETNLSARLVHDEVDPVVITEGEKIKWQGDKVEAHFYDLETSELYPEGAYEFDVVLKERPVSNVVEFTLQTKGLDFFYQPALTDEEIADGASRPENVVGSYAIYASENKTNWKSGTEYKCGKVGHIYRPKITDSNGVEIWGDLNVNTETGILSITINPGFLRRAKYPVTVDPTFGYATIGASNLFWVSSRLAVGRQTLSEDGSVSKLTVYANGSNGGSVKGLIYDDDGAAAIPGTQMRVSAATIVTSTNAWYDLTFSSSVSLTTGNWYLGTVINVNSLNTRYDIITGPSIQYKDSSYTTPASPWGSSTASFASRNFSIYATYTVSGGQTWSKSLADTITISDALAKTVTHTITDSVIPTDQATNTATGHKTVNPTDTITISDALAKTFTKKPTDTVTITDTIVKTYDLIKADTITMTDVIVKTITLVKTDTATMTDQITLPSRLSRVDTVIMTDVVTTTTSYHLSLTDTVTISDVVQVTNLTSSSTYIIYQGTNYRLYVNGVLVQSY